MSPEVVRGRRGQRIVLDEYPKGFAEELSARLTAIGGPIVSEPPEVDDEQVAG